MKILVIAEGSTPEQRAKMEWGLSLLVNDNVLFDTYGLEGTLKRNIKKHKVRTGRIKKIIISHDHWDHAAGLGYMLSVTKHPSVYMPVENDKIYDLCRKNGAYMHVSGPKGGYKGGFTLTGSIKGRLKRDIIMEHAAVFEGKKGPVLVLGCSHPGVINMIKAAVEPAGKPVYAVVGGLHLKDTALKKIKVIARRIKALGVKKVIAGHCTGDKACEVLKRRFKNNFIRLKEGAVYEL